MGRRFCVRCGSEEGPDNPIIDSLCPKCFVNERSIIKLPNTIKITICPVCGSVYYKGSWIKLGDDLSEVLEYLINNYYLTSGRGAIYDGFTDVSVKVININEGKAYLSVKGTYKGTEISHEYAVNIRVVKRMCPKCTKVRGRHFEAVVQIRSEVPIRSEVVERISLVLSRMKGLEENIVEVKEYRDGVDIKLLSQSVARQLANILKREFAAKITQTWKDSGYVSGRKRSKLTISVRVPGLLEGDIVEVDNVLAVVTSVKQGRVVLRRLDDGGQLRLDQSSLWERNVKLLTPKDYAVLNAIVLGYEGGKAVVQAEESGNVYYIAAPKLFKPGTGVKILIYKGRTYLMI
ncbi:MAG: hypothetical protein J7L51_02300 [Desulfurococcales archaeon]|nr:hypothetical protein [Desulfurococcales archaeon]